MARSFHEPSRNDPARTCAAEASCSPPEPDWRCHLTLLSNALKGRSLKPRQGGLSLQQEGLLETSHPAGRRTYQSSPPVLRSSKRVSNVFCVAAILMTGPKVRLANSAQEI
ncbi:hypothetical protein MRX96_010837 [Rhipicephalus microplus]